MPASQEGQFKNDSRGRIKIEAILRRLNHLLQWKGCESQLAELYPTLPGFTVFLYLFLDRGMWGQERSRCSDDPEHPKQRHQHLCNGMSHSEKYPQMCGPDCRGHSIMVLHIPDIIPEIFDFFRNSQQSHCPSFYPPQAILAHKTSSAMQPKRDPSLPLPSPAWVSGCLGAFRYRTISGTSSLTRGVGSTVGRVIGATWRRFTATRRTSRTDTNLGEPRSAFTSMSQLPVELGIEYLRKLAVYSSGSYSSRKRTWKSS